MTPAAAPTPPDVGEWGSEERTFDEELQRQVAESCGNGKLRKEIERYTNLVRFVRWRVGRHPHRLVLGHAEHLRILAAFAAHDT